MHGFKILFVHPNWTEWIFHLPSSKSRVESRLAALGNCEQPPSWPRAVLNVVMIGLGRNHSQLCTTVTGGLTHGWPLHTATTDLARGREGYTRLASFFFFFFPFVSHRIFFFHPLFLSYLNSQFGAQSPCYDVIILFCMNRLFC